MNIESSAVLMAKNHVNNFFPKAKKGVDCNLCAHSGIRIGSRGQDVLVCKLEMGISHAANNGCSMHEPSYIPTPNYGGFE